MEEAKKLLKVSTPEGTDRLLAKPEQNYIVKSPGMMVKLLGGRVVYLNRAARRRNKIYGVHARRTKVKRTLENAVH